MTEKLEKLIENTSEIFMMTILKRPVCLPTESDEPLVKKLSFQAGTKAGINLILQSDEFKNIIETLEMISTYEAYNGDTWPAETAKQALTTFTERGIE